MQDVKAQYGFKGLMIESYIEDGDNDVVIRCAMIELLHNINRLNPKKESGYVQNTAALKVSA